ncbi:LAMI_0B05732g1_1 [Lachancea mirantina]|uniref:LAMI_0B05732g1_1 n=1 Tax=Lachancea mirantina TaxID=1230905 RepID=A0A1G4IWT3_9SACH|nr:LAMI_0B05732g1_1 [Lachancea mirantina]
MNTNEVDEERDQVIAETPVGGRILVSGSGSEFRTLNERTPSRDGRGDPDFWENSGSRRRYDRNRMDDDNLIFQNSSFREVRRSANAKFDQKSTPKTPDLDKLKRFFKNRDKSRQGSLISKLQRSPDDTPELQRGRPDYQLQQISAERLVDKFRRNQVDNSFGTDIEEEMDSTIKGPEGFSVSKVSDVDLLHLVDDSPSRQTTSLVASDSRNPVSCTKTQPLREGSDMFISATDSSGIYGKYQFTEDNGRDRTKTSGSADAKQTVTTENQEMQEASDSKLSLTDHTTPGIVSTLEPQGLRPSISGQQYLSEQSRELAAIEDQSTQVIESSARDPYPRSATQMVDTEQIGSALSPTVATQADRTQQSPSETSMLTLLKDTPNAGDRIGNVTQVIESPFINGDKKLPELFPISEDKDFHASPSTKACSASSEVDIKPSEYDNKVRLRFSNKADNRGTPTEDSIDSSHLIVMSDMDVTQELPEIEETAVTEKRTQARASDKSGSDRSGKNSQQNSDVRGTEAQLDDSQDIVRNRRELLITRRRKTAENETQVDEKQLATNEQKHANKRRKTISYDSSALFASKTPNRNTKQDNGEIDRSFGTKLTESKGKRFEPRTLTSDAKLLSRDDIVCEDAIWCHYSVNFFYYPGKLLRVDGSSNSCEVLFESGISKVDQDDVYYLDLKVGETVRWKSSAYVIVALECTSQAEDTIRCVRGYDTLHLRKKFQSGKLEKEIIRIPLSSITLGLGEWAKRSKIVLLDKSDYKASALNELQYPIRGRKNTMLVTPVTPTKKNGERTFSADPVDAEQYDKTMGNDLRTSFQVSIKKTDATDSLPIFDQCLFLMTGFTENRRREISSLIEQQGGVVCDESFSSLFTFDEITVPKFRDERLGYFKFACLITEKHSRSLKYLETLALGWPPLHWKFVDRCITYGKLDIHSIHQFLLPAGESHRLSVDLKNKCGVVKSSDVFYFFTNLLSEVKLSEQLLGRPSRMSNFSVIIWGHSELDDFVEFVFRILKVKFLRFISKQAKNRDLPKDEEQFDSKYAYQRLDEVLTSIHVSEKAEDILIYLNERHFKPNTATQVRRGLQSSWNKYSTRAGVRIEGKEWLIQTVINGDPGFLD